MAFTAQGLSRRFGNFHALKEVSFEVARGEVLGIAGPNGAGKSTLLNVCTGVLRPSAGSIAMDGRRIDRLPLHRLSGLGLARTFQIPQVFASLDVETNIRVGGTFGTSGTEEDGRKRTDSIVELLNLRSLRYRLAGEADLLTRKMIMLGAALATGPSIVFMDEPFGGLNAQEIEDYAALVERLRDKLGLSFVIVEHKMRALTRLSDRLLILNFGETLCEGTPDAVLADEQVNDIYLARRDTIAVH
ncbi:ATP-binding cassette domain-containing protein [Aquibium sp. A9E412]|uniref:ABC transporter ATP-binding protein n=1 Tax=Aquibium sp. A9E412 TaxID=2976767 RepID=UPI0025B1F8A9|nr:ATP-binding cassette domain-containing protein [Aquibium sp. A9E412]MDN2565760.1 ATP-binding cassette domain-containing protein [Aquibium sp. A9E412]